MVSFILHHLFLWIALLFHGLLLFWMAHHPLPTQKTSPHIIAIQLITPFSQKKLQPPFKSLEYAQAITKTLLQANVASSKSEYSFKP